VSKAGEELSLPWSCDFLSHRSASQCFTLPQSTLQFVISLVEKLSCLWVKFLEQLSEKKLLQTHTLSDIFEEIVLPPNEHNQLLL